MNTTNTNEPIERKEKQKGTLFVVDLEMRDYFAAKAMQALNYKYSNEDDVARHAYILADAMLKARKA